MSSGGVCSGFPTRAPFGKRLVFLPPKEKPASPSETVKRSPTGSFLSESPQRRKQWKRAPTSCGMELLYEQASVKLLQGN